MKFGILDVHSIPTPYSYPHVFMEEEYRGGIRLKIAPSARHIDLLLALSDALPEPFFILYVLLIPHDKTREGRYQSLRAFNRAELREFFTRFGEFFEEDGRHHVWICSGTDRSLLVYDKHNYITAYGPLEQYKGACVQNGLEERSFSVPVPHVHMYPPQYRSTLESLMNSLPWTYSDLKLEEDDPE